MIRLFCGPGEGRLGEVCEKMGKELKQKNPITRNILISNPLVNLK
jgi:hypothetical protein